MDQDFVERGAIPVFSRAWAAKAQVQVATEALERARWSIRAETQHRFPLRSVMARPDVGGEELPANLQEIEDTPAAERDQ